MPVLPIPRSFPTGNAHNLVVHLAQSPRDDADRAVQIAADGLTSARHALAGFDGLPPEVLQVARLPAEMTRKHVADRNILHPAFRDNAGDLVLALDGWLTANGEDPDVVQTRQCLIEAIEASERVADIAAADRHVSALRAGRRSPGDAPAARPAATPR